MTLALPDLVAQVERAHYEAIRAASSAVDRAIACGELLIRAKAEVRQHGRWLDWVEANLSFGERQAQKYMRLAAHKAELANTNSPSSLFTINGALAAIRAPPQDDDPPAAEPPQAPDDGRLFGDLARAMNAPTWGKAAREQRRRAAGASARSGNGGHGDAWIGAMAAVPHGDGDNGVRAGRPQASRRDSRAVFCRDRRVVGSEQRVRCRWRGWARA